MLKNTWIDNQLGNVAQALSRVTWRPIVLSPPRHVALEVTSFCNLRCPMCKLGQGSLGREMGLMDFQRYCKVIDEISPYVPVISYPWYGEPFTNKHFGRFVRYASDKGMVSRIQTNGTLLHQCDIDFLTECKVKSIIISIDGLEQRTYEQYRVGGNLEQVIAGARRLVSLRRQRRSPYPQRIQMNYIVMKHNEHELPRVEEFGGKLGFDRVKIKTAHVERTEEGMKFLPSDDKYRRYETDMRLKSGRDSARGCSDLWRSAVISWDGRMGLCCIDYDCQFSPGNVFAEGFFGVWYGSRMSALRRQVLADKSLPICRRCEKP